MENNNVVISEREKELGSHITKCKFLGCRQDPKSKEWYNLDFVQLTNYRKGHNNGYTLIKIYAKKDKLPKYVIPFAADVDVVFLNVPEGEKPVFLRIDNLQDFASVEEDVSAPVDFSKVSITKENETSTMKADSAKIK